MNIQEKVLLAPYTTFKIGGTARFFCVVKSEDDLFEAVSFAKSEKLNFFVIGGGSNILISDSGFDGLVIKMEILGRSFADEIITASAGENWDDFVDDTINRGYFGLENLSAIPGTVGASPVQNIGAYGVEVSRFIEHVRVLDVNNLVFVDIKKDDCGFEYRDSIFKHQKRRFIVTAVTFVLKKEGTVDISYKDLSEHFKNRGTDSVLSARDVRNAVIEIRKKKLPDWNVWGTAGSFFKNPVITVKQYIDLKQRFPNIPSFPTKDGKVKVSLGWILDKICHAKGLAVRNAHIYEKQALVVVAKPWSSAKEVIELTKMIQDKVKEKTGIDIEAEVEWVN